MRNKTDQSVARHCILAAEPNFNTSLMASYISEEIGIPCIASDIPSLGNTLKSNSEKELLCMVDCLKQDRKTIIEILSTIQAIPIRHLNIALYNTHADKEFDDIVDEFHIKGLFNENCTHENLTKGITAIFDGEIWLSRRIVNNYYLRHISNKTTSNNPQLTKREIEIIKLIAEGIKNDDIANILCLSPHTIKTHLYRIYKKIQVENRIQAASWATEHIY